MGEKGVYCGFSPSFSYLLSMFGFCLWEEVKRRATKFMDGWMDRCMRCDRTGWDVTR